MATSLASAAETTPVTITGDATIISPQARLEEVFNGGPGFLDGGYGVTEGCACAADGTIYFSEIVFTYVHRQRTPRVEAGHIYHYDPRTGKTVVFRSPSGQSNGIKFDAQGRMIVAEGADFGGRRVTRTDLKTGKSEILAGLYEGRAFNAPNDISIDEKGRIYFSDPRYIGHEAIEQPLMGVYRIDTDGSVHRIITDVKKPNGVCVSPDQKTLYVVCNDDGAMGMDASLEKVPVTKGRMALLAYDLSPDGTAKFRKVLVDYAPNEGPDGLVADAKGNIYVAVRDRTQAGVGVYSPEGKKLASIGMKVPTNVCFGRRPESSTLYVTASKSLYRIRVENEGYQLPRTKE